MKKFKFVQLSSIILSLVLSNLGLATGASFMDALDFENSDKFKYELSLILHPRDHSLLCRSSNILNPDGTVKEEYRLTIPLDKIEHILIGSLRQCGDSHSHGLGTENGTLNRLSPGQFLQWPACGGHFFPAVSFMINREIVEDFACFHIHARNQVVLCKVESTPVYSRKMKKGSLQEKLLEKGGTKGLTLQEAAAANDKKLKTKIHTLFPENLTKEEIIDFIFTSFDFAINDQVGSSFSVSGNNLTFSAKLSINGHDVPFSGFFKNSGPDASGVRNYELHSFHPSISIDQNQAFLSQEWLRPGDILIPHAISPARARTDDNEEKWISLRQDFLEVEILNEIADRVKSGEELLALLRKYQREMTAISLKELDSFIDANNTFLDSLRAEGIAFEAKEDLSTLALENISFILNNNSDFNEILLKYVILRLLEKDPSNPIALAEAEQLAYGFSFLVEFEKRKPQVASEETPLIYAGLVCQRENESRSHILLESAYVSSLDIRRDVDQNDILLTFKILKNFQFATRRIKS